MARFHELVRKMTGTIDSAMGDTLRVVPMRAGSQYQAGGPDPVRQPFELTGRLASLGSPNSVLPNLAGNEQQGWSARMAFGKTVFRVDPSRFPSAATVRKGDVMETIDADRIGVRYQVAEIDRGQRARIIFELNAV